MNPQTLRPQVLPEDTFIESKCSIAHYNIQSLSTKVDLIESELRNCDAVCLTETWLDRRTSDETIKINGFMSA